MCANHSYHRRSPSQNHTLPCNCCCKFVCWIHKQEHIPLCRYNHQILEVPGQQLGQTGPTWRGRESGTFQWASWTSWFLIVSLSVVCNWLIIPGVFSSLLYSDNIWLDLFDPPPNEDEWVDQPSPCGNHKSKRSPVTTITLASLPGHSIHLDIWTLYTLSSVHQTLET